MEKVSLKLVIGIATLIVTIVGGLLGYIGTMISNDLEVNAQEIARLTDHVSYLRAKAEAERKGIDIYAYADLLAELGDSLTPAQRKKLNAVLLLHATEE